VLAEELCVVDAVRGQLGLVQGLVPADERSSDRVARGALAEAVLDGLDLHVVPVFGEGAENAAVPGQLAVPVRGPLPDAHRGQVRWLGAGDQPLVHRVVGDAGETDLAVAPRLLGRPLDAVVEVLCLPGAEVVDVAG